MTIFICYDTKQKKYFEQNGFKDVISGLHKKTLKPFWIYERTIMNLSIYRKKSKI